MLAYHYLTDEHADAALRQLKVVSALQPKDTLSAQLIAQLDQSQKPAATTGLAQGPGTLAPAPSVAAAATPTLGKEGKLEGSSTAEPAAGTKITVVFQSDGRFAWKVDHEGKTQQFEGKYSFENGILTLVQDQNNNTMVGNVTWQDESHFNFKVMGNSPADPGLSFTKTS